VFEDGRQTRDFVHVRDVARANVLALTRAEAEGPFNVASGDPHSVGDMAAALASEFDGGRLTPRVTGAARLGDVRHVFASADRAARVLGFRAAIGFGEGMRELAHAPMRDTPA
jgi:dTDP-L-rhamnose 4-epimerase